MKDASQFPITTPYGQVPGYPLNNGFHQGIDYGCPVGTPVVVNGIQIGLSGATGYVQGAHLHVGRFVGGRVTNPVGGFHFDSAIVTETHNSSDSNNGKYVRIQGDGASWVYLHLSRIDVQQGQELKGGEMPLTPTQIDKVFKMAGITDFKEDLANQDYANNPGLLIDTLFNAAGERPKAPQPPKVQTLKTGFYEVK